jgi:hypothetical protein
MNEIISQEFSIYFPVRAGIALFFKVSAFWGQSDGIHLHPVR